MASSKGIGWRFVPLYQAIISAGKAGLYPVSDLFCCISQYGGLARQRVIHQKDSVKPVPKICRITR